MKFTKQIFTIAIATPLLAALGGCTHNIFIGQIIGDRPRFPNECVEGYAT